MDLFEKDALEKQKEKKNKPTKQTTKGGAKRDDGDYLHAAVSFQMSFLFYKRKQATGACYLFCELF